MFGPVLGMRILALLLLLHLVVVRCAGRRGVGALKLGALKLDNDTILPPEWGRRKREEVMKAFEAEQRMRADRVRRGLPLLPRYPTHTTLCDIRTCRPGEGNLKHHEEVVRGTQINGGKRFIQWTQPYEHREAYVQTRSRRVPHTNDAEHYGELIRVAEKVATSKLVLVTSGDWDYRGLVWNWLAHASSHGHTNTVVLSMDTELHRALVTAGASSFDDSANLAAWNTTCIQRHIQVESPNMHMVDTWWTHG